MGGLLGCCEGMGMESGSDLRVGRVGGALHSRFGLEEERSCWKGQLTQISHKVLTQLGR